MGRKKLKQEGRERARFRDRQNAHIMEVNHSYFKETNKQRDRQTDHLGKLGLIKRGRSGCGAELSTRFMDPHVDHYYY